MRVWEVATGRELLRLEGHTCAVYRVTFTPDGQRLISWAAEMIPGQPHQSREVKVWNLVTGREEHTFAGPPDRVFDEAFSPDGRFLAVTRGAGAVEVWDVLAGEKARTFKHTTTAVGVAFSPDGRHLAAITAAGAVRVWDVETGQELLSFKGTGGWSFQVALSPDGRRLASAGSPPRLWDAQTGLELLELSPSLDGPIAFSPDGRRLAGVSGSIVYVWDGTPTGGP